ncbi:MAG: ABC transporter, permease protein [Parcubacteria group bacterium GW2011_GWA2_49_9]|nr:MAG: ABC transporter, permease protein [Parcubacteria group bacterium GW2011_GWA2_49_9]
MTFADLFHETIAALSANKVRTGLTMLGIIIGIASVISMVSIGEGAKKSIEGSIQGLGSNLLTVMPGVVQPGRAVVSAGRGSSQTLKNTDAEALRDIQGISAISPELNRRFQITAPTTGFNTNSTVIGAEPDYALVRNLITDNGSFITAPHLRGLGRVAVLGPTAATDLFGEEDPVGQSVRINKMNFTVIGTLQKKGSAGFFNPDDMIFVPLSTMQKLLSGDDYLSTIAVSVTDKDMMPIVQQEITALLAERHRVDLESPDFSVISQADILGTLTQVTTTFTLFLASIASISLLVGGIGIMNMMLTTVTERTREIGLRKAIGAKRRDINLQFLAEAVMLTFTGGLIGILLGWLVAFGVTKLGIVQTSVSLSSILLAFGVSGAIGIIFGYYPARRASNLSPIEALRYE